MAKPGVNVYDIRKDCVGPLCYDFSDADTYLNSPGEAARLFVFCDCFGSPSRERPPSSLNAPLGRSCAVRRCPLTPPTPSCGRAAVRKALGVGNREWEECNMLVHAGFWGERRREIPFGPGSLGCWFGASKPLATARKQPSPNPLPLKWPLQPFCLPPSPKFDPKATSCATSGQSWCPSWRTACAS
jgi:hypothetical protein